MSSWQNHYFLDGLERSVSHGVQDGLERSFVLCCEALQCGRSISGSVLWVLWCISPMPAPASPFALWLSMGQSVLVSVLGIFSVPGPTTCTEMVLKWFLFLHLCHFLPHAGHSLGGWYVLHLLHVFPGPPSALLPFLNLMVLISSMVAAVATPPLDLCQLKSFTVILCSLACWRRAVYVTSSLFFFDLTHILTSKASLHGKATLFYVPIFHYRYCTGIFLPSSLMHWSSWSVVSCSPCLMSLYISSMWFQ